MVTGGAVTTTPNMANGPAPAAQDVCAPSTVLASSETARIMSPRRASESRRSNKPIMEKRRRARINNCLNELKTLILDAMKKDPARHSKLEKADILEMTVRHLESIERKNAALATATDPNVMNKFRAGFKECTTEVSKFPGLEPSVRRRLLQHLSSYLNGPEAGAVSATASAEAGRESSPTDQNASTEIHTVPSGVQHGNFLLTTSVGTVQLMTTALGNSKLAAIPPSLQSPPSSPTSSRSFTPPSLYSESGRLVQLCPQPCMEASLTDQNASIEIHTVPPGVQNGNVVLTTSTGTLRLMPTALGNSKLAAILPSLQSPPSSPTSSRSYTPPSPWSIFSESGRLVQMCSNASPQPCMEDSPTNQNASTEQAEQIHIVPSEVLDGSGDNVLLTTLSGTMQVMPTDLGNCKLAAILPSLQSPPSSPTSSRSSSQLTSFYSESDRLCSIASSPIVSASTSPVAFDSLPVKSGQLQLLPPAVQAEDQPQNLCKKDVFSPILFSSPHSPSSIQYPLSRQRNSGPSKCDALRPDNPDDMQKPLALVTRRNCNIEAIDQERPWRPW